MSIMYSYCFPCVLNFLEVLLPPLGLAPLSGHGGITPSVVVFLIQLC